MIVTDNDHQFTDLRFTKLCQDRDISQHFTAVGYPQANEEAEVTNQIILQELKARTTEPKELELMSYIISYGPTEPSKELRRERLLLTSPLEPKLSSL